MYCAYPNVQQVDNRSTSITVDRDTIPQRGSKARGHFSGANVVDQSPAKKDDVAGEESNGKFSRFILDKCAEVLDPTGNL